MSQEEKSYASIWSELLFWHMYQVRIFILKHESGQIPNRTTVTTYIIKMLNY